MEPADNRMKTILLSCMAYILWLLAPVAVWAQDRFEADPVAYSLTPPQDAIAQLQARLRDGATTLTHDPQFGYLKAILDALEIPPESQVLVFSKTSFQADNIGPASPRAIYFNDDVYLGMVQWGDVLEISTADPNLGAVFYTLKQEETARPQFVRRTQDCLQCHASRMTRNIPGHLVRSVVPDQDGFPLLRLGTHLTTQNSPLSERWGGWYVTGTHGRARHMGNVLAPADQANPVLDREAGANRTTLDARVRSANYLTPHSDIVALMLLEHQVEMHNLLTQANYDTRFALRDQAILDGVAEVAPDGLSESTQRRIASAGDKLVRYMLFVDEAELEDPVAGASGFAEAFARRGPHDSQGRSLREFDLRSRLFKYPLSYLIYSAQFDGLPPEMKAYVYRQLWDILTGVINTPDYLHLTNYTSRVIREILLETKPDLPDYWRE